MRTTTKLVQFTFAPLFEEAIKKFCDKKRLPVRYFEDPKKLTSEDFWDSYKKWHLFTKLGSVTQNLNQFDG